MEGLYVLLQAESCVLPLWSQKFNKQWSMITKKIVTQNGCGSSCASLYIFKNINRGQPLLAKRALVFGWKIPLLAIYEVYYMVPFLVPNENRSMKQGWDGIGEDIFVVVILASNTINWLPLFHLRETPFVELVSYQSIIPFPIYL